MVNREEVCVIPDHVVDGHEHFPRYGDDGLLVAPALFQRLVFVVEVRILFRAFCSCKGTLHQERFQVMSAVPCPCGLLLSCACIVCGGEACSGGE